MKKDTFRYSICEPLNPEIVEKGSISANQILRVFQSFPWQDYLQQMADVGEHEIQYSPSLEFENLVNRNGITVSAIGTPDEYEFYLFYQRPKLRKPLFGLITYWDKKFLSELRGEETTDVEACLIALANDNLDFLETKFP